MFKIKVYNSRMSKYSLSKKTGKNFCDELWTTLVKLEHNNQCPICVSLNLPLEDSMLNAHHLISRRVFKYRWEKDNGILICPKHHEFDLYLSAHTAPWAFDEWVKNNMPEKYNKWVSNRKDLGSDGVFEYEKIYHKLEEQHKAITGSYYKIQRIYMYLLSLHKSEIIFASKMGSATVDQLANKYEVPLSTMKRFLKAESLNF